MAQVNWISGLRWGFCAILGLFIIYLLRNSDVLGAPSVEQVDESLQIPVNSAEAFSSSTSMDFADTQNSEQDYLVTSLYQPDAKLPRLHRKLLAFRNVQMFQKLPQDTTPPPAGPSPISNRVHLQEMADDNSVKRFKNNQHFRRLPQNASPPPAGPSPISNRVHLQEISAGNSVKSFKNNHNFQRLPQDSTPPPAGPSPISNRVHLQETSADTSVKKFKNNQNFQRLPQDSTPPPAGPSPISNRVHLQEMPAESSFKTFRNEQNFQKLPQETTPPPEGPSPISNRVHLQELSDDYPNLESTKQSVLTRGDSTPTLQNQNHAKLQEVTTDKSWQDQSNSPSSSTLEVQKNMMNSNVPTRAQRYLRSINNEAVYEKLGLGTLQGAFPLRNRLHFQEISSSNALTDTERLVNPSPLPPVTSFPDSVQGEEHSGGDLRLVFQMLPRETALPPSGPSPVHN